MDEVLEIALAGKLPKLSEETPEALATAMPVPPAVLTPSQPLAHQ